MLLVEQSALQTGCRREDTHGGVALENLVANLLAVAVSTGVAGAAEPPRWTTEGPFVDASSISLEIPVQRIASKLYVEVEIGGEPRLFVFDTGSPSMIDAALAYELGLEAVDRREGRDSHGAVIASEIVQADLRLGDVMFRKVPLFATDFSASPAVRCLVGNGVLGSEILPLCAWQIDLPDGVLRCRTDPGDLDHVGAATQQRLYDFGYPHLPILDVGFGKDARSKAMFDTGSAGYFVLSPPDLEGADRAEAVGRKTAGSGSLGGSMGGQAPAGKQTKAELKSLSIGSLELGSVEAVVRESPPSLIGAALLEHFVVTLDARSGSAWLDPYRGGPFRSPSLGFSLAFDEEISIGLVWEDSPAARAGLSPGTPLTAINGEPTESTCEGIRRALAAMSARTVELSWEGGSAAVTRARDHQDPIRPEAGDPDRWRADHHMHLASPRICEIVGGCLDSHDPPAVYGSDAVAALDAAGVARGVVLSCGYLCGLASAGLDPEAVARCTREENELNASEVAEHDRLVGFLSVDPSNLSAIDEIRHWRDSSRLVGVKLHLSASRVDLGDPGNRSRLAEIVQEAAAGGRPLVVHVGGGRFGSTDAEIFLREILPEAEGSWVQIAHAAGGMPLQDDNHVRVLRAFADRIERNDPATRKVLFDLSYVPAPEEDQATVDALVREMRRIGLDRFLFGSDYNVLTPVEQIEAIRRLGLTAEEERALRENCAPWACP